WDFLFERDEKATVKPPYVRRFPDPHFAEGDFKVKDFEDRYVLATSSIYTPAWGVGSKGLRITSDAGSFALRDGPLSAEFPSPPPPPEMFRIKLDGARLASSAEALATALYDDAEEEMGNAQ